MTREQKQKLSGWEDHIKTGLISLIAAGIGWVCLEITELSSETRVNQNMIKNIQSNMERVANNQYPNSEAKRDWKIQRQRDENQNKRIEENSRRLDNYYEQIMDMKDFIRAKHSGQISEEG